MVSLSQRPSRSQPMRKITTKNNGSRLNSNTNNKNRGNLSISMLVAYVMGVLILVYVSVMVLLAKYTTDTKSNNSNGVMNDDDGSHNNNNNISNGLRSNRKEILRNDPNRKPPRVYSRDEWGDRNIPYSPEPEFGHGVKPEVIRDVDVGNAAELGNDIQDETPPERVMTAYLEHVDQELWKTKPLPMRTTTKQELSPVIFKEVNSCSRLMEQIPADNFPDDDPYLPWLHDVFPTHDGKFIQFVAQNKRRCRTGTTEKEKKIAAHMAPQVALFQHVAVKRIKDDNSNEEPRYRLTGHEDADEDGMATRFICRFSNGEETLSIFNFSYEWASYRKKMRQMFHKDGRDNKQIHTSQLLFQCPVPESLVETIRTGVSVINDYATLFVDIVPIRTPPRYGPPNEFLPPYYKEFSTGTFDALAEYGDNHVLPRVEDSGRWENIPICKPTLLTYGKQQEDSKAVALASSEVKDPIKQHRLVSCLWASTGYATRGNRFAINDGQRRLLEWITYNKLIGVEHFYLYDNSAAFSTDSSLQPIADLFPDDVTLIKWPAKVCNNNKNNVDSVGERSSQYAAEASCRLRFGPHTDWIAQFDIDEYLVPMGNLTSIHTLLDKLDEEGKKIVSFGSWRAWPRRRFIEDPNLTRMHGARNCGRDQDCFQLRIPMNQTMLQAYNCDRQKPGQKTEQMPAEKQIYRPDYVKHHFIHYSTVTGLSVLNKDDMQKLGRPWNPRNPFPDPLSRFGDEVKEALMLHTKAVATQDTVFWESACSAASDGQATCRLGTPFPENMTGVNLETGDEGWKFNCYVNHKIDDYWVRMLEGKLKEHVPEIAQKLEAQKGHIVATK
ncbi:glycosyltransferase family 92 protein [Nitzschia inconspicua]|uniref:Glycosyltransferase family 92 protein n=1 Tax=Nitzschia inconspicua TaxID=303405 RepID=A0A9K3PJ71_9STRA|nr:glycosyltransferase family 92 protein [Nitzschia inconspicua]